MKQINTLIAMGLLAASSAAFAASDFDNLDVDGNGTISKEEATADAVVLTQFDTLDVNKDGELTKEEFALLEE